MEQAIQDFIASLATQHGASGNTLAAYHTDLRQLHDFMTRQQVATWGDIQAGNLDAFVGELTSREYATTSIARKLAAVKAFFHYLHTTGQVNLDPTAALISPVVRKEPPRRLTTEEVSKLFAQLNHDSPVGIRDTAMLHTLHATGMRVSELIAVSLRDVDVDLAHIFCPGRDGRERILPLTPPARSAVAEYLTDARPGLLRGSESSALFLNHHGERLTRQGFWLIMKGYARAAGLGTITPHTLRHAFALDKVAQGMELRSVQQLLGHANLSTTQIYRRAVPAQQTNGHPSIHQDKDVESAPALIPLGQTFGDGAVPCGAQK